MSTNVYNIERQIDNIKNNTLEVNLAKYQLVHPEYMNKIMSAFKGSTRTGIRLMLKYDSTETIFSMAKAIMFNPCLIYLSLTESNINDAQIVRIAETLLTASLVTLDLSHNKIGALGVKSIVKFLPASCLTTFNLASNCIVDEGAIEIANVLCAVPNLTELTLCANKISDEGTVAIATALPNSHLRMLDLAWNKIQVCGATEIAANLQHSSLIELDLQYNYICDVGMGAIFKSLASSHLITLYACANRTGNLAGIDYGQLKFIDLSGNMMTCLRKSHRTRESSTLSTCENIKAFMTGVSASSLTMINLKHNNYPASEIDFIIDSIANTNIVRLDIGFDATERMKNVIEENKIRLASQRFKRMKPV